MNTKNPRLETNSVGHMSYYFSIGDDTCIYDLITHGLTIAGKTVLPCPVFRDIDEFSKWCTGYVMSGGESAANEKAEKDGNRVTVTIRVLPDTKKRLDLLKRKQGIFIGREIDRMVKELCDYFHLSIPED